MRIQFISKTSTSLFSTFTSTSISNSQSTCRLPTSTLTLLRSFNSTSLTFGMSAAPYKSIATDKAPSAIGPYVQATVHNGTVYCSGCIPFVPETMTCIEGGVEAQAEQALKNLFNVLEASGSDKSHVLKTSVFLKDMNDFAKVNVIYEKAFAPYKPARSAVEVARLPRDVLVEIEAIAAVKN